MHKGYFIFCVIIFTTCLLGCQDNPQEVYVVNKNEEVFESLVKSETLKTADIEPESESVIYKDRFYGADNSVEIIIDAKVDIPHMSSPVIKVMPHEITLDEV